jgi:hypothetical protein
MLMWPPVVSVRSSVRPDDAFAIGRKAHLDSCAGTVFCSGSFLRTDELRQLDTSTNASSDVVAVPALRKVTWKRPRSRILEPSEPFSLSMEGWRSRLMVASGLPFRPSQAVNSL